MNLKCPDQLWGLPSLMSNWNLASFLGHKWLGYEVNQSSPSSTEVKSEWTYISVSSVYLHGKDTENFTFFYFMNLSYLCTKVLTFSLYPEH